MNPIMKSMKPIAVHNLKTLKDYTAEQVKKFDEMHQVLTEYNASLGTDHELPLPPYSRKEMADYSGYRELVIAKECEA
jgi:hypothetical protein